MISRNTTERIQVVLSILLPVFLLGSPASAEPTTPSTLDKSYQLLVKSKIPNLVIEKQRFSEAFGIIQKEWEDQHPDSSFPVSVTEFVQKESDHADFGSVVTLRLKNVPFHEALMYLAESSRMKLLETSGLLNLSQVRALTRDWTTQIYEVDELILDGLGLNPNSKPDEIRVAYAAFEINLADWMNVSFADGKLIIVGYPGHHAQITGLHHLLRFGFTVTRAKESEN